MSFRGTASALAASALIALGAPSGASAGGTQYWTLQSQQDWSNGTPKNVAIADSGEMTLAPEIKSLSDTDDPYVWSLADDGKGTIYAGTGNSGRIYRLAPGDEKASIFVETPEVAILSLAMGPDGFLYAGTAPSGLVYRIDPSAEIPTPTTVYRGEGISFIWSLVFGADGALYASTGDKARVIRLARAEGDLSLTPTTLLEADETHLISLALRDGLLYAGSDGSGLIFRVDPQKPGKGFVVLDSEEREIHTLTFTQSGDLFATGTAGQPPRPQRGGMPQPSGGEKPETTSYIYRISKDGVARRIWKCPDALILCVAPYGDGNLLVGTGNEGKLYIVTPQGDATAIGSVEASQPLVLRRIGDQMVIASGNTGKLFALGASIAREGTWESKPQDAAIVSTWGTVRWDGSTPDSASVRVLTRSGNTEKPDKTWSEWSSEYADAVGTKVESPPARFLQIKIKLASENGNAAPMIRSLTAAYLQGNVAPELRDLQVAVTQEEGRNAPAPAHETRRTARWKANDTNGDALEYSLYYRLEGEKQWHLVKDEIKPTNFTWDSAPMPDGDYRAKVVATDAPSNPVDRAVTSELVSELFSIDHSEPQIGEITVKRITGGSIQVLFVATDATSYVGEAKYSVSADDWKPLFPVDGIFDSRTETFEITLHGVPSDASSVAIGITDVAGNTTTARARF